MSQQASSEGKPLITYRRMPSEVERFFFAHFSAQTPI
jgi:hypothetical protein